MIKSRQETEKTNTQRVLDHIAQLGSARSDDIESALGIKNASALLASYVMRGQVLMCKVERPGRRAVNEYRIGCGMTPAQFKPLRSKISAPQGNSLPAASTAASRPHGDDARLSDARGAIPSARTVRSGAERGDAAGTATPARAEIPPAKHIGPIERGVPLPPSKRGVPLPPSKRGNGELRACIEQLQVGDSFETDFSASAAYNLARSIGIKVEVRPVPGADKRVRIWRTA